MDLGARFDRFVASGRSPAYVVSVARGERSDACLVGFATQCSIHPRRFAVCLSKANLTWRIVAEAPATLAVHRLRRSDAAAAEWFGGSTGDEVDTFADWSTTTGTDGVPLIDALPDRLVGREVTRLDVGDHVLVVLDPIEVHGTDGRPPFTVDDASRIDPGHPAD